MSVIWPKVKLSELLSPLSRPQKVQPGTMYRLLGARWYAGGLYIKDNCDGSEIRADKVYQVQSGDFVYNRLFAWKGSFAVADAAVDGCYVSNEFPCFTPRPDRVHAQYLRRYMSREAAWTEALGLSSGGTPTSRNRLKEEMLLGMAIPLPPIEEQRRIVARIDQLAAKIAEARGLCLAPASGGNQIVSAEAKRIFDEISRRHAPTPLGEFDPVITSGPRNWSQFMSDTGIRFYRAQDIRADGKLENTTKCFIQPPKDGRASMARLKIGDIMIIITGATVGRCAVYKDGQEPGYVSQHVAVCRFGTPKIKSEYVWWGLRSPLGQEQLLGQRYGQGKPGLNLTNIRTIAIPIPDTGEQCQTVAYLDGLSTKSDSLKQLQKSTSAELAALLPSILDRAFRGEL